MLSGNYQLTADVNSDGVAYMAYCWTGVQGFSQFGIYMGNGNANGPFLWTGFTPEQLEAIKQEKLVAIGEKEE